MKPCLFKTPLYLLTAVFFCGLLNFHLCIRGSTWRSQKIFQKLDSFIQDKIGKLIEHENNLYSLITSIS